MAPPASTRDWNSRSVPTNPHTFATCWRSRADRVTSPGADTDSHGSAMLCAGSRTSCACAGGGVGAITSVAVSSAAAAVGTRRRSDMRTSKEGERLLDVEPSNGTEEERALRTQQTVNSGSEIERAEVCTPVTF